MITIGIPNIGTVHSEMLASMLPTLFHTAATFKGTVFDFVCPTGGGIDTGRNSCAERAVATQSDYLFFIDSDLTFPPHTLTQLIQVDKDIIGATYNKKRLPLELVTSRPRETLPGEVFKTEGVPTGLLLIRTAVFNLLPKPWFAYQFSEGSNDCMGEDTYFCRKAVKFGFELWCDPTIDVKHIGAYTY